MSSVYIVCSVYGENLHPLFHASQEAGSLAQALIDAIIEVD